MTPGLPNSAERITGFFVNTGRIMFDDTKSYRFH